jgi:ELWxxDGT repeat protein
MENTRTIQAKPYLVNDIEPGYGSSGNSYLTNVNGTLYFFTNFPLEDDYYDYVGIRLWKSDGTRTGTVAVQDISPIYYREPQPLELTSFNGIFYFLANNDNGYQLWKSDGTSEGTVDVASLPGGYYTSPRLLANINGTLYFSVNNINYYHDAYNYDSDLWKSDGTEAGTFRLKEFGSPDDNNSVGISSLININGTLYFFTSNFSFDEEGNNVEQTRLWKSDGTTAGTVPFKEFSSDGYVYNLTQVDNMFYFTLGYDNELWKSDGTEAGTVKVKDINALYLKNFNDTLYFLADPNPDDGITGYELWKSDGTAEGTVLVKDIKPGPSGSFVYDYGSISYITNVDDTLYFIADDGIHGRELWKSDGTAEGTVLVKDINPGSGSSIVTTYDYGSLKDPELTNVNGILYFVANDGIHGQELWKSDGTAEGTVLVEDIKLGSGSSSPSNLTNVDGTLYFNANDGIHGTELWALNTNPAVVSPIVSITALNANAAEAGNKPAVFRISRTGDTSTALTVKYNVDGTATNGQDYNQLTGTVTIAADQSFVDIAITPVTDTFPEGSETVTVTLFDQYYQYYIVDPSHTAASASIADDTSTVVLTQPYPVKDIFPGTGSSYISYLRNVDGTLFFTANDGIHGQELWKSDGTTAGTVLVKDINPSLSDYFSLYYFANANGTLYFLNDNTELWKSDGTQEGTVLVKDFNSSGYNNLSYLTSVNDTLYFRYINSTDNRWNDGLWKSDGTEKGTVLVKNVLYISNLTDANGILYFNAYDDTHGRELWKSDGTTKGTVLVKDINPGSTSSSDPSNLINVNGTLYFNAYDDTHGRELWKSDGTKEGTVLVKDINPGSTSGVDYNYFVGSKFTNVNGLLYFIANDGIHGSELWKSDGTKEGTVLVKDINPGSAGSFFDIYGSKLIQVRDMLYFTLGDSLWKSDGTEDGTVLVKDINPESNYYDDIKIYELVNANGTLYFSADDGINGRELWKSDGTTEGTVLVKDLNPGDASSNPHDLTYLNDTLYFAANDGIHGEELWAIKNDESGEGQTIKGTPGRDTLVATNFNDIITGLQGADILTGGDGNDQFVYTSMRDAGDKITDFVAGMDQIVLTPLFESLNLSSLNYSTATAQGYLSFGTKGSDTCVLIDPDGTVGRSRPTPLLTVKGVSQTTLAHTDHFLF